MENTSCGDNCCFVKSGFCKTEKECPFYVESWWIESGKEVPTLIKDCHTKRSTIEQNNNHTRLTALQQSNENIRNRLSNIENLLIQLIAESKQFLKDNDKIESKSEFKKIEEL